MASSNYPIGFPIKINGWKGKPFYEVMATIQLNTNTAKILSLRQLRKPLPLRLYRKEIHNITGQVRPSTCSGRISMKITDIDMPGSTIVSETLKSYSNGLVNTLDINPTTLTAENGSCNTVSACFSPANNALKRVRSAGMIPRKFNESKNNTTYNTSTQQYLVSRNRTIKQNEFNYIRKGDSGMVPGPGLAASNIYSPAGLSHCTQPVISSAKINNSFAYIWADGVSYTVTIPDGVYDIFSLNAIFQTAQFTNHTYLAGPNNTKVYLMAFSYDTRNQSIILITNVATQTLYPSSQYGAPLGAPWTYNGLNLSVDMPIVESPYPNPTPGATYIAIPPTGFADIIGFAVGTYYNGMNETSYTGEILPKYVPLYYKPNNPEFGVQGAVDSSARIQRIRYNTITDSAALIKSAYGPAAANAMAYGVSEQAYTAKSVVGDKPKLTPVINPKTGIMCKKQFIYKPR